MDSVAIAIEQDFEEWRKKERRQKRSTQDEMKLFQDYLKAMFEIDHGTAGSPTVRDILVAITAEDVDRSIEVNAVREAAMTCQQTQTAGRRRKRQAAGLFDFLSCSNTLHGLVKQMLMVNNKCQCFVYVNI